MKLWMVKSRLVEFLSILLIVLPVFPTATAQPTAHLKLANSSVTADITVPPGHTAALAGSVSAPDGIATFTFEGGKLTFGDGFGINTVVLANTRAEYVSRLTAFGPDDLIGPSIVIAYNKITATASRVDIGSFAGFLSASHDFQILSVALPGLTSPSASGVSSFSALGCAAAIVLYISASVGLVAACGVPEPVEPVACAAALLALTGAGLVVADQCG